MKSQTKINPVSVRAWRKACASPLRLSIQTHIAVWPYLMSYVVLYYSTYHPAPHGATHPRTAASFLFAAAASRACLTQSRNLAFFPSSSSQPVSSGCGIE